jgi:putative membrane-bound dehydrogenase-like protein
MYRAVRHWVFLLTVLVAAAVFAAENDGPLTPEQALAAFKVEPNLSISLAAAEPLVADPVAIAWDERGRMFVVENRGYPTGPGTNQPPLGMIAMLEEGTNGDGRYVKRTVFADGLTFPNGVMCWRGGVFVTCAPDIFYLKDMNGDGRADVRKVVLTGFNDKTTTQLRVSHPTLGLDGWVHLTSGLTGGKITSPEHPERPAVEFTKSDSRFHPDTYEFEITAGQGQFGLCFDDFGRKFVVDNRHPLQHVVLLPRYLKRNQWLAFSDSVQDAAPFGDLGKVYPLARDQTTASFHPNLLHSPHAGTFTSSCGICIYSGDALPPSFMGNAFICEPAQSLVQRQTITSDGASFKSKIAREGSEFLVTTDNWFRPVFAANGPDGALYIASMYRKFIDHPQYVPEDMRGKLDFVSGRGMGRIYRVTMSTGRPQLLFGAQEFSILRDVSVPDFDKADTARLVTELGSHRVWWRETARRLLLERGGTEAALLLKDMIRPGKTTPARVLALRTLGVMGALDDIDLRNGLGDKHPAVREHALQLAEPRLKSSPDLTSQVLKLAYDLDPRVRFHCALALGESNDRAAIAALARIATRDAEDRWTRAAVLSSVSRHPVEFMDAVLAQSSGLNGLPPLMADAGQVIGASQPPENILTLLNKITSSRNLDFPSQAAAVNGMSEALRRRKLGLKAVIEGESAPARQARTNLSRLTFTAIRVSGTGSQPLTSRQIAITLLTLADYSQAGQPLQDLLRLQQPTAIQTAAAKALLQMPEPGVAKSLLEAARWRAYTPPVRETILAGLLSQATGAQELLTAVESGAVAPTSIDPQRRNSLMKHKDKTVAAKATELFKTMQGGDRMKVYEEFKPALALKGNLQNGRAIFTKSCANCHRLDGEGSNVGPELTGIRNQPAEVLLLHIIVPSYEIVAGFNNYEIETRDGRTISGLLASESPGSMTLRRALGEEESVLRSNIATMSSSNLSLMPDELEKTMSMQDLRDLIAFLKGE